MTGIIDPSGKVLAHLDRVAALKTGTPPPVNVEIDLSNRCSLGCEWCHFAFTHTRGPLAGKREKPAGAVAGGDLMPVTLAQRIIDMLADAGVLSVTWTGGGEPTLHPHFDHIVEYAAGRGLEQGIYTHGGHITMERAALLKAVCEFVYVSLDAANASAYQRDKGVDRFSEVLDGIRLLVAAPGPATVGVGYLVTSRNWMQADVAAELAAGLGVDYLQFRPTVRYSQQHPGQVDEDTGWVSRAVEFLRWVARRHPDLVIIDDNRFRTYQQWAGHGYETCWWSGMQTVITPNGSVWTCVNKREHPAALLGDLSLETFDAIWRRRRLATVDHDCRVLCRGHLANRTLDSILSTAYKHPAFP